MDVSPGREPCPYHHSARVFLQGLGGVYLLAFVSLWLQVTGLVGQEGILPATLTLEQAWQVLGRWAWWELPSIFWLSSSDLWLNLGCAVGAGLALLVLFGRGLHGWVFLLLWSLYLSFCSISGPFLGYQWDVLLLETGLLAVFLRDRQQRTFRITWWLLRLLLVKLLFLSGIVKLTSGDVSWWNLTALQVHFESQPLPGPLSWWVHHFPVALLKLGVVFTLTVEILLPFLAFGSARARLWLAGWTVVFMGVISATGNYGFFNLLTVLLCLSLLDDVHLPASWRPGEGLPLAGRARSIRILGAAILCLSFFQVTRTVLGNRALPQPAMVLLRHAAPLRSINSYGLFRVMTTDRYELVLEGTLDGTHWEAYRHRWKPQALDERPRWAGPHMPRLDWQLWFASLVPPANRPAWIQRFQIRVLEGSMDVTRLLRDPFEGQLPLAVRVRAYDYRFSTPAERKATGHFWMREDLGLYAPAIGLVP